MECAVAPSNIVHKNAPPMETIRHSHKLPALTPENIHIWGVNVSAITERMDQLERTLNAREREKAARFRRDKDRSSSIAARGALRILLSGYTGIPAAEIAFVYSNNGKPHIKDSDIAFNVSHSAEWVLIAIGYARAIGVDIEKIKQKINIAAIAKRYFSPEEQSAIQAADDPCTLFFELWTRKEAYVKACGSTLFSELKQMSVPVEASAEKDGWFFHRLEAGSKYAAAVVSDKPVTQLPCYDFGASFR